MTIDMHVKEMDDNTLEEIDEIMEETMVQMFILQPCDSLSLERAKTSAEEYDNIFYSAPLELIDETDENCIGFSVTASHAFQCETLPQRPLFIDEMDINDALLKQLLACNARGVILNATHTHPELESFHLSIGPSGVAKFDQDELAALPMDRILLQSCYPDGGFDEIYQTAKKISDAMFRPEQSIIARATKSSLELLGFRKG